MSTKIASLYAEIGADTSKLKQGLQETKTGMEGAKSAISSLASAYGPSILATLSFAGAVKVAYSSIKESIEATAEYGMQVRDLSLLIGATAEESSKLIQAADDVFVSFESLERGMQIAIRQGLDPTIEGMGQLADEYNSIKNPIEQSRFLLEKFGRSGAELAPLMKLGASGLKELGDAAEETGLVLDDKAVDSVINYKEQLDELNDMIGGIKTQAGMLGIEMLAEGLDKVNEATGSNVSSFAEFISIAREGYQTIVRLNEANNYAFKTGNDNVRVTKEQIWHYDQLGISMDGVIGGLTSAELSMISYAMSLDGVATSTSGVDEANKDLDKSEDAVKKRFGFAKDAAKDLNLTLAEQIALKEALALASGEVTQEELDNKHAQELLVTLAGEYGFKVGQISDMMTELAVNGGNVTSVIQMITTNLAGLPRETRMKILIEQFGYRTGSWYSGVSDEYGNPIAGNNNNTTFTPPGGPWVWYGKAFGAGMHGLYLNTETGEQKEFARGGHMQAGSPYLVGEAGPELVVPDQHSMVVPNDRLGMGGNDLLSAILRMPTAQDIAIAVRDAVLLVSR